jgi:5-formyltetrahydrofolate cyclo-ligase
MPYTAGIGFGHGYIPWLEAEPHDVPLDAMLTEDGVFWQNDA